MADYIWLIPAFPAVGFLVNGFFGRKLPKAVISWIACLALFASFVVSALIFVQFLKLPPEARLFEKDIYNWIASGEFSAHVGYRIDSLSIVMCLVVSGVGFLIHVYSAGYMHEDEGFARYFAYLNLFVFMMLTLVTANNLLFMFVGWEGVGLCSYLLIGFWYKKDIAANAGKKAFIVNRIGDFGFLLGIFLLLATLGSHGVWTLNFGELQKNAHLLTGAAATLITLLFFVGAAGKSAQLPLYVWLPDAMEGPTPVSSLIHAATMVTAGVYMIARLNFLYAMAPTTMFVVTLVGVLTALFAATIGCAQYDIKRVLAYSTISQLGYMFVGVGAGALCGRHLPPYDPCFFQRSPLPSRRQRDARHERRAGHAENGRFKASDARHLLDLPGRLHRHCRRARLLRVFQQRRDHVEGLRQLRGQLRFLGDRRRDRGSHRVLHVQDVLQDLPRRVPGAC